LRAGVFDEYGLPAFEKALEDHHLKIHMQQYGAGTNIFLNFPDVVVTDKVHAYVIRPDGTVEKRELRLPPKCEVSSIVAVGNDLAVSYHDSTYKGHLLWLNNSEQHFESGPAYYASGTIWTA